METAARMMNSAMVMKGQEDLFSTVDISELDLYDGTCRFIKSERRQPLSGEMA